MCPRVANEGGGEYRYVSLPPPARAGAMSAASHGGPLGTIMSGNGAPCSVEFAAKAAAASTPEEKIYTFVAFFTRAALKLWKPDLLPILLTSMQDREHLWNTYLYVCDLLAHPVLCIPGFNIPSKSEAAKKIGAPNQSSCKELSWETGRFLHCKCPPFPRNGTSWETGGARPSWETGGSEQWRFQGHH